MKHALAVLGRGGRRLVIAERLHRDFPDAEVWIWPPAPSLLYPQFSTPGFADESTLIRDVAAWAVAAGLTGVVVVDERLLFQGVADSLAATGLSVIGANQAAARVEADKLWAKHLLRNGATSTGDWVAIDGVAALRRAVRRFGYPLLIKRVPSLGADGVVAVLGPADIESAWREVSDSGAPSSCLFAERFVAGPEIAVTAIVTPGAIALMPPVEVFPRRHDAPESPLTGGMGAITFPSMKVATDVCEGTLEPLLHHLDRLSGTFSGPLTLNLRGRDEWTTLEVNTHFGDPETQCSLASTGFRLGDLFDEGWTVAAEREVRIMEPVETLKTSIVLARHSYPGGTYEPIRCRSEEMQDLDVDFHPYDSWDDPGMRSSEGRFGSLTGSHPITGDARLGRAAEHLTSLHPELSYRADILEASPRWNAASIE